MSKAYDASVTALLEIIQDKSVEAAIRVQAVWLLRLISQCSVY